jgi:hypothetical protein
VSDLIQDLENAIGFSASTMDTRKLTDVLKRAMAEVKRVRKQKEILIQSIRDHYSSASESDDIDELDKINRTLWNEVSPFTGVGEL